MHAFFFRFGNDKAKAVSRKRIVPVCTNSKIAVLLFDLLQLRNSVIDPREHTASLAH